jgi:hypothetical protein
MLNDGQTCSIASQCASNVCTTFYVDTDGDGYGGTASTQRCGSTPPYGFTVTPGDCCDVTGGQNTYPGSPTTSTSPNACGSYDYNCNGQLNKVANPRPTDCGIPTCTPSAMGTCLYVSGCTCAQTNPTNALTQCTINTSPGCGTEVYSQDFYCQQDSYGNCPAYRYTPVDAGIQQACY